MSERIQCLCLLHHPLAGVEGVNNAIFISGDAVGEIMCRGRARGVCQQRVRSWAIS